MRRFWFLASIVLLGGTGCAQANNVTPSSFSLTIEGNVGPSSIVISPGASFIALRDETGISLYELETQSLIWTAEGEFTAIDFSPDESLLAANRLISDATIWDVKTGKLLYEVRDCSHGTVGPIALTSSNQVICVSGAGDGSGTVDAWDYTTFEQLFGKSTLTENGPIGKIILSPDETTIANRHDKGMITLLDAQTGMIKSELGIIYGEIPPQEIVYCSDIAFNPSGDLFAASYTNGIVGIRSVETGELVAHLEDQTVSFYGIAWSHDGNAIAAGTEDGKIYLMDSSTFEVLAIFDDQQGLVEHLAFTFDDQCLVSASREGEVITYNVDDYLP